MAAMAGIDLDRPRTRHRPLAQRTERAGQVVVHPDRVNTRLGQEDALHLTARQLPGLIVRPMGWDPNAAEERAEAAA